MIQTSKIKIEYGDFQTPIELAEKICRKLLELGVNPEIIIEPTCGIGNFIDTSARFFRSTKQIIGIEINPEYVRKIKNNPRFSEDSRIQVYREDFFLFDWSVVMETVSDNLLVIGNFPWVTNARQGSIAGDNLPIKTNFQNHSGLDAMTGKSNFDISEWMLIQMINRLQKRQAYLAMLCKTSVARKILNYIKCQNFYLEYCATYKIDAKTYFDANVDACLLFCKFDANSKNHYCDVLENLETSKYSRIGYEKNILIKDLITFQNLEEFYQLKTEYKWRSGVKHDCSNVMEFKRIGNKFINGFGEAIDLEETFLFPLFKGSDVARGRTESTDRYVIITQRSIGEPTDYIQEVAPKTWDYLHSRAKYLDNRKSKIYQNNPRFSIFGVGDYTFFPWKIAICGLYKKLDFRLIGTINDKPAIFDDTVYFLAFENEFTARQVLKILNSNLAKEFYSSLIFWDEKRPVKTSILNSLNLRAVADRLSIPLEN